MCVCECVCVCVCVYNKNIQLKSKLVKYSALCTRGLNIMIFQ